MRIPCPICKNEFYASPSEKKRGQGKYCSNECFSVARKEKSNKLHSNRKTKVCPKCKIEKQIDDFGLNRSKAFGLGRQGWCKDCMNENKMRSLYGLTKEEIDKLKQRGCFICGRTDKLRMDHNHKTGELRGILCNDCNAGIGFLKDSIDLLRKAIEYLT